MSIIYERPCSNVVLHSTACVLRALRSANWASRAKHRNGHVSWPSGLLVIVLHSRLRRIIEAIVSIWVVWMNWWIYVGKILRRIPLFCLLFNGVFFSDFVAWVWYMLEIGCSAIKKEQKARFSCCNFMSFFEKFYKFFFCVWSIQTEPCNTAETWLNYVPKTRYKVYKERPSVKACDC